jgi:hypothetical protein
MTSHLNIGVRHLLPMFPFVAILGAGFISGLIQFVLNRSNRFVPGNQLATTLTGLALAAVALAPCLAIAISIFPNYLTYFSPLAGGTNRGWQTLSDSNVETGQEVKPLAAYLKQHGESRVTGIMVGGEFLKFYGVELNDFPGWYDEGDDDSGDDDNSNDTPDSGDDRADQDSQAATAQDQNAPSDVETKYVAIGAWYLSEIDLTDRQKQIIEFYRHQQPEAMVGNSIFVFRR